MNKGENAWLQAYREVAKRIGTASGGLPIHGRLVGKDGKPRGERLLFEHEDNGVSETLQFCVTFIPGKGTTEDQAHKKILKIRQAISGKELRISGRIEVFCDEPKPKKFFVNSARTRYSSYYLSGWDDERFWTLSCWLRLTTAAEETERQVLRERYNLSTLFREDLEKSLPDEEQRTLNDDFFFGRPHSGAS